MIRHLTFTSFAIIDLASYHLYFISQVPFDNNRLVFPPVGSAVMAYCFYVPFVRLLPGGGVGLAMFSGGLLGYVIYDLTHYYLHHGAPERGSYLHSLKHYHVLHHFDDHSSGLFLFLVGKKLQILLSQKLERSFAVSRFLALFFEMPDPRKFFPVNFLKIDHPRKFFLAKFSRLG